MTKLGKDRIKWSFFSLIKLEKDKLANSVCRGNIFSGTGSARGDGSS